MEFEVSPRKPRTIKVIMLAVGDIFLYEKKLHMVINPMLFTILDGDGKVVFSPHLGFVSITGEYVFCLCLENTGICRIPFRTEVTKVRLTQKLQLEEI